MQNNKLNNNISEKHCDGLLEKQMVIQAVQKLANTITEQNN